MIVTRWVCAVVVVTGVFAAASASAQEKGQVGVTAGSPGLGVIWHASDNVALRAELTFGIGWGGSHSEPSVPIDPVPTTLASSVDSHSIGTGVSALFYLARQDSYRTYFTPRFNYSRSTSTFSNEGSDQRESTNSAYGLSGSFGAQYILGNRFGVFGEVGLAYSRQASTATSTIGTSDGTSGTFGVRTGVGVAFYF